MQDEDIFSNLLSSLFLYMWYDKYDTTCNKQPTEELFLNFKGYC